MANRENSMNGGLVDLLVALQPPLGVFHGRQTVGCKSIMMREIAGMGLPCTESGEVHFFSLLYAMARRVYADCELPARAFEDLEVKVALRFPELVEENLYPVRGPDEPRWVGVVLSAL